MISMKVLGVAWRLDISARCHTETDVLYAGRKVSWRFPAVDASFPLIASFFSDPFPEKMAPMHCMNMYRLYSIKRVYKNHLKW